MTEFEHDWLAPATVMPPARPSLAAARLRLHIEAKLDEMKVRNSATPPWGLGYMAAVNELRHWLDNEA